MTKLVITSHTEDGDIVEYDSSKVEKASVEKKANKKNSRKKQKDVVHEDDRQEKQT